MHGSRSRFSVAAAILVLVLTACGGGGGTAGAPGAPAQPVVPVPVASSAPTSAPATAPQSTAQITLTIPAAQSSARARSPQYISPNSGVFQSTVVSVNGSTTLPNGTPAVLTTTLSTASGGNCKTDQFQLPINRCVVTIQAPTGTVVYRFDLFDKTGTLRLASASPTFTMPATGLQAQLSGIVAAVDLFTPPNLTSGETLSDVIGFNARDASGAIISGTYLQPFSICSSDTSGHTAMRDDSPGSAGPNGPPVQCVLIVGPQSAITLSYDGAQIPPITFSASGGTLPAGGFSRTIYAEPRIILAGTVKQPFNVSDLTFTGPGQTKSFTASQTGHSGPFGFTLKCGSGANAIVSVATADNITFALTALKSGNCSATVSGLQTSVENLQIHVP